MSAQTASPTVYDFSAYFDRLSSRRRSLPPQTPLVALFMDVLAHELSRGELAILERLLHGKKPDPEGTVLAQEKLARLRMAYARLSDASRAHLLSIIGERMIEARAASA